jgi:hypothetical protein
MRAVLLLAGAVVLLAVVSCATRAGSGGGRAAGTGAGTGTITGQSCSIAPASLINSTLDVSVGDPEFEDGIPELLGIKESWGCHYDDFTVVVDFGRGVDAAAMAQMRSMADTLVPDGTATVNEVPGIGDEAFLIVSKTYNGLMTRNGDRLVEILSGASVEQEKSLAAKLFGRF